MANPLLALSTAFADTVAQAGQFIVSVAGHPRFAASGIHWRDGLVITADHTLKQQEKVVVTGPGGAVTAKLVGRDASTDIALLQLESAPGLNTAVLADDTPVRAGTLTLVVGRSVHNGVTASMGVISAAGGPWRTWSGGHMERRLQLDMSLYPSSNGGAVVDMSGAVIGLATSAFSRLGALAVPSSTVERVVTQLLETGHVPRGYLGVGLRPVQVSQRPEPALITLSVEPGSAADRAGWLVGDVLLGLNGKTVTEPEDVLDTLGPQAIGQPLEAAILRGGVALNLTITVGSQKGE